MTDSIQPAITEIVRAQTGQAVTRITPIRGQGLVNHVFEVVTLDRIYILRANTGEDDYGIYQKEKWCVEQVSRLGVPVPQPFLTGKQGEIAYSLYPKISGKVANQVTGERDFIWRRLGEYARKYHQIAAYGFGSGFSPDPEKAATMQDWLDYYLDYIFDNDRPVEEGILRREDWIFGRKAIEAISQWDITPRLCHGNPVLKNVIVCEDSEIALIDWGTACGHLAPQVDLAEILVEHPDDRHALEMFLGGYGLGWNEYQAMEEQLWTLQAWRLLSTIQWALKDTPAARKNLRRYKQQLDRLFHHS